MDSAGLSQSAMSFTGAWISAVCLSASDVRCFWKHLSRISYIGFTIFKLTMVFVDQIIVVNLGTT